MQTHEQSASPSPAHVPGPGGQHLLLYDGVCGLCNRTIAFVLPRDPTGRFRFAALQSAFGRDQLVRHGRDPDLLDTFFVIENYRSANPHLLAGARAALFVAQQLNSPWKHVGIARILPNFVLEALYTRLARNRYLLFGKLDQCLLPDIHQRGRFIDIPPVDPKKAESLSSPRETLRSRGTLDPKTPVD